VTEPREVYIVVWAADDRDCRGNHVTIHRSKADAESAICYAKSLPEPAICFLVYGIIENEDEAALLRLLV
jgi:hypothetical protein